MHNRSKKLFISLYNKRVPSWKKLTDYKVSTNKQLDRYLTTIEEFVAKNNLSIPRLIDSIFSYYQDKKLGDPILFNFTGGRALNIYKNYKLSNVLPLSEVQEILVAVKKTKKVLNKMIFCGIVYSKGVKLLQNSGKANPYFLLAHGLTEGVPTNCIEKWNSSDELKQQIVNILT
jgi:hypothetical protein